MADYTLEAVSDNAAKFVPRPFLYTKKQWSDPWQLRDDFIIESATFCAGGQDLDTLIFRRKYGLHIPPWGTEAESFEPLEGMESTWIRLGLEKPNGNGQTSEDFVDTVWGGQVVNVKPEPQGSSASGPYGEQVFTCYGPAVLLRKVHVAQSFWDAGKQGKFALCQWSPTPNDLNGKGIGNRSKDQSAISEDEDAEQTYLFGDSDRWTCGQFARYLIYRFAPASGFQWSITGNALGTLDEMDLRTEWCNFGDVSTLWEMLHAVIRPDCGIDFLVRFKEEGSNSSAGFEIVVFSLVADDVTVGSVVFPKNPDRLQIISGGGQDFLKVDLVNSDEYRYSKIRLYGDRIVSCMTLWGEEVNKPTRVTAGGKFVSLWSEKLEYDYRRAGEDDEDECDANDTERMKSEYSEVFRRFGVEEDVDLVKLQALFFSNGNGEISLIAPAGEDSKEPEVYQHCDRQTESFLPIAVGEEKPVANQFDEDLKKKELAKPLVWIKAYEDEEEATDDENFLYRPVNELGFSVAPLDDGLGVSVEGKPPHILAWNDEEIEWEMEGTPTAVEPQYDWKTMAATIAFKTDRRVFLEHGTGDSGGTLEEVYPKAQCWVIAKGTAYAYTKDGFSVTDDKAVVRNDIEELERLLAAKIARYQGRGKAVVELFAARNVVHYLGTVLTLVTEDDWMHAVNAPVTEIRLTFSGGASRTIISAGYPA